MHSALHNVVALYRKAKQTFAASVRRLRLHLNFFHPSFQTPPHEEEEEEEKKEEKEEKQKQKKEEEAEQEPERRTLVGIAANPHLRKRKHRQTATINTYTNTNTTTTNRQHHIETQRNLTRRCPTTKRPSWNKPRTEPEKKRKNLFSTSICPTTATVHNVAVRLRPFSLLLVFRGHGHARCVGTKKMELC